MPAKVLIILIASTLLAHSSLAEGVATESMETAQGSASSSSFSTLPDLHSFEKTAIAGGRDGALLWTRFHEDPIYTSCGISEVADMAFAGLYLNPPKQVEVVPLLGNGTPDWTYSGSEFYVDASHLDDVLAAVDIDLSDSTAVISAWVPGSSTPLWSHEVGPCRSLTYAGWASRKPIQVSDDGSTVAVALVTYNETGEQRGHLYAYEADTGNTLADWEFPTGNVVATALSSDGNIMVMAGWPTLYVYDLALGALRWSGPIGSGNDALAVSSDGDYIGWGWTTFNLRQWNGSSYTSHWSHTPGGGLYLGQVAFAPGDQFAVSWDNGSNMVNEVSVEMYELATLDLIWHYDYQGTPPSTHVDIATSMVFSTDGNRLAVGSWGGSFPEIHVFDANSPAPVYTLDTPGSIFDIDIIDAPGGGHRVAACGKGVHAGTGGRGGHFYAIDIPGGGTAVDLDLSTAAKTDVFPNPMGSGSTISFTLDRNVDASLKVYDLAGRLVHEIAAGEREAGRHQLNWDGHDQCGMRLPAGVYFIKLNDGTRSRATKVILID